MDETREQKEQRKNSKTNFKLSAKRTKIKQAFHEELRRKYETATPGWPNNTWPKKKK